jgi:hypothetical protein
VLEALDWVSRRCRRAIQVPGNTDDVLIDCTDRGCRKNRPLAGATAVLASC